MKFTLNALVMLALSATIAVGAPAHAIAAPGDHSLTPWATSTNWRSFDDDVVDRSPEMNQGWDESARVISSFAHLPVTSQQLRTFWDGNPSTSSPIDTLSFSGNSIAGRDKAGHLLFSDTYRYVTTRVHGLEDGPTEIFRADHLRGRYGYIALMAPEAATDDSGQPMARHFHFRFGATSDVVTEHDHGLVYLTMVDHSASPEERARTVVAFHRAIPAMIDDIGKQLRR